MKRAARKQVKKFGKGGLNRYASMMADKLKSPTMSPTERDRIQRAVDQGFTNIVYHSTDTPWDEIDLNYTDVGLHAGTPTQAANRALDKAIEAKLQERREQGQYIDTTNVLPLAYRPGKTLRMPDVGEFKDAYTTLLDMRTAPELRGQGWMHTLFDDVDLQKNAYPGSQSKDWLDSMENRMALAEIRRNLLDRGYRQIAYPNTHENAYGELTNLMPEYQDQLDQLSRDADALYQKSLSMRPQAPQPGATEQEIEAFLHPRDPLSYLDPEEAALYNKYRNEMQRIEMSPGAYETGESIIFLDPSDVRSVYAEFAPEAAQQTGLGKKQGGPVYDHSRINQMVDDLLDPMYEFEPYDDEAYEVQRFAKGGLPTPQRQWLKDVVEQEIANYLPFYSRRDRDELVEAMEKPEYAQLSAAERAPRERKLAAYRGRQALMDWMSGTATKYLKRDFGTEFDPMRDLSIRHVQSDVWPPREIGPYSQPARAVPEYWKEYNSWVEGLDPETPVYMGLRPGTLEEPGLNIRHLRDELLNAMSAETGLPRNLQIRPESLQRMSFPQASELVGKISQYRAEQAARRAAELDEKLKPDVFKQYPEGYRWVRLNKPGQFEAESELMGHSVRGYEPDAGPGYGLGGWPAIERGEAQVYSLRDPQGLPHVTVEAANFKPKGLAAREMGLPTAMSITQIKGKQNQAPVGAYLPYVQDFVRSGNWKHVLDLENARLRDMNRYSPMQEWMKSQGIEKPRYLTEDEYQALEADFLLQQLGQKPDGMKEGGIVEDDFLKANPGGRVPLTLDDLVARYAPDPINALIAAFDTQTAPNEDGMSGLALSVAGLPQTFSSLGSLGAGALRSGIEYLSPMAAERMREVSERGAAAREMLIPETVRNAASTMMAGSANASQAYDDLLNQMLEKRGLGPAETLSVPSQFALAGGEMFGQAPLPQAKMLKSTAKTIGDMIALPFDYFGPTVDPKLSNYALGTLLGGASRAAFSDLGEQVAERQAQIDYDDLMQMLRRNAAIDLPSTRELTAKMPARPMRERMAYTPPSFPGMAKGGQVYDPARIESMVNELMEPQKLAKGGLPTPHKAPGKDVPRAEMPDADYLTPAEREFLNRSVRTGMQVSERVPTSTKFEGDPYDPSLTIGVDVIRQSPEQMRKQAETMSQYANYPVSAPTDPESVFGLLGDQSVENLLFLYDQVPEDVRRMSSRWYEGANRIADEAATKYGIPIEGAAGVYASLSPQMDWFKNVSLGDRVMEIANNYGDFRFSPEMGRTAQYLIDKPKGGFNEKTAAIVDQIKNSSLNDLSNPREKAVWLRLYDETYNPRGYNIVDPLGNVIGPSTTAAGEGAKVGWGSLKEIAKALSIFQDPTMENINRMLGEMHKVRSFYNNIVDPYTGRSVTSDTHNVAAALMRPLSGTSPEVEHNLGSASSSNLTGARGTYGLYADAVRRAAAERGVTDPRAMQSITWEAIRGLYSPESKRSDLLQDEVANAMNQYRLGRITGGETREQLLDIGGGINLPAWYGR